MRDTMAVCSNCKREYREGDKYCRYCGAPMGTPRYIDAAYSTIYGPPPEIRTHKCTKCGFTWTTDLIVDDERWCPECGGSAPYTQEIHDQSEYLKGILSEDW